jgi:predicted DNA-binding transcriptional regulator AlpA
MNSTDQHRFINIREVCERVCLGKTTVLHWEATSQFPRAVRLSPSKRVWLEQDVNDWIRERHEASAIREAA